MNELRRGSDADAVDEAGADRRTRWGRLWRYVLGPPLYYFDCRGPDGRPAHAKVLSTCAFFVGLVWVGFLLHHLLHLLAAEKPVPGWMATLILAFASLVFGLPYGLDGYKTWLKTKGGGTVEALGKAVVASEEGRERPSEL